MWGSGSHRGQATLRSVVLVTLGLLVALVTMVAVSSAVAQDGDGSDVIGTSGVRGFVKFDGIDGESVEAEHRDWSDLATFDQALVAPATAGAGRGAVQPKLEDILVAKALDKAGPLLQDAMANGRVFPKVEIELVRDVAEGGGTRFYRYELKNVRVTSYNVGTTGQSELTPSGLPRIELGGPTVEISYPVEELSLACESMIVTYVPFSDQGEPQGDVVFTWNPTNNR